MICYGSKLICYGSKSTIQLHGPVPFKLLHGPVPLLHGPILVEIIALSSEDRHSRFADGKLQSALPPRAFLVCPHSDTVSQCQTEIPLSTHSGTTMAHLLTRVCEALQEQDEPSFEHLLRSTRSRTSIVGLQSLALNNP